MILNDVNDSLQVCKQRSQCVPFKPSPVPASRLSRAQHRMKMEQAVAHCSLFHIHIKGKRSSSVNKGVVC